MATASSSTPQARSRDTSDPHALDIQDAAQQAETAIEPATDGDSSYETDSVAGGSEMTSLSSSVRDYTFENGRRYHRFREGAYNFPNDDAEQDREDMKHALVVAACGDKLAFAPIGNKPQRIIDLGTGTGIWCIEVGDQYPSAQVVGIDLSPIQPVWVPPNVQFLVDDAESPWTFPNDYFDLVHCRHMVQAFKDYSKALSTAYKHIKPGGWVELQELIYAPKCDDGTMPDDYVLKIFLDNVKEGLTRLGPDMYATAKLPGKVKDAGFVNITDRVVKLPVGPWAKNKTLKKVGLYLYAGIMDGLQAIAMGPMTRGLGKTPVEVELFLKEVREGMKDSKVHSYFDMHIIYGQKPE
ncbi:methyltransferase domain-containing protein [Lineolata rhizophorae]|uniref:Methyltransferase domain-containing protein n=1 Tax=Lineolata rhizophorae TaxID=578093 RepID=A0A6A6NMH0_9PEZI|nr:methyltransferase domain-containing protein [Lineolata rhizophorae]